MDSIRRHHHGLVLASAISLVLLATICQASIENEPVKVTHRNSGPSYDFDDVERTRLNPNNAENTISNQPQRESAPEQQEGEPSPIGHLSIRRIFLVPVSRNEGGWTRAQPEDSAREQTAGSSGDQLPAVFGRSHPLWPFMAPGPFIFGAQPSRHQNEHEPHQPHLLGTDEASRSPNFGAASNERPSIDKSQANDKEREETLDRLRPMFDPIRMMVDLMHQALNPAAGAGGLFGDMDRDASTQSSGDRDNKEAAGDRTSGSEFPVGPLIKPAKNETKEEVVEIDGKKYLRKTVINRHIGDNIIFMTKRLIFVPLNETDSELTTTTTTTVAPAIIVTDSSSIAPEVSKEATETPKLEQPTTRITAATSTDAAEPTVPSTTPADLLVTFTTQTPSTTKATEETTMKEGGWTERVSEAVDRVAERIVELGATSTVKPEAAKPAQQSS